MNETLAREHAERARTGAGVPSDFALEWIRHRWIELEQPAGQGTGAAGQGTGTLVADRLVWIARFSKAIAWWEVAIDDQSGASVRVQRSRSEVRRG